MWTEIVSNMVYYTVACCDAVIPWLLGDEESPKIRSRPAADPRDLEYDMI